MASNGGNIGASHDAPVEIMIEKLMNPVVEIRWRALQNIISKLEYGLENLEDLIMAHSGRMITHLLKWFSDDFFIPEPKLVLKILMKIIRDTTNGMRMLINFNARSILQHWVVRNLEDQEAVSQMVREISSELLTSVSVGQPNLDGENITYGEQNDNSQERCEEGSVSSVDSRSTNSFTDTAATTAIHSCSSPADFLSLNRNRHAASKIPKHLLQPDSLSSDHQNTSGQKHNQNRMYSPITRSYLKRRVTFNDISDGEDNSNNGDDGDTKITETSDVLKILFPFSSLLSDWHTLARTDRNVLENIASRLKSNHPKEIRNALRELSAFVVEDFAPEVLIQRPEIVFIMQDILMLNQDYDLNISSAHCLEQIVLKLQGRLKFSADSGFLARKNCDVVFNDSTAVDRNASAIDIDKGKSWMPNYYGRCPLG